MASKSMAKAIRYLGMTVAFLAGVLSCGCNTVADRVEDIPPLEEATDFPSASTGSEAFELGPGDELDLQFINHPEFSQTVTVRPDGKVSIRFAEEVVAAGRTVEEFDRELTRRLSSQLKDPEVTVLLRSTKRQLVYVGGEVKNPGKKEILGGAMHLTEAVLLAGGYVRDTANIEEVIVLRQDSDGVRHACKVNLEDLLVDANPRSNVALRPLDIVIVPPKEVVDVNDFIDRYINRNLPGRGLFGVNLVSN